MELGEKKYSFLIKYVCYNSGSQRVTFTWDDEPINNQPFAPVWKPAPLKYLHVNFTELYEPGSALDWMIGKGGADKDFEFNITAIDVLGNVATTTEKKIKSSLTIQYPTGAERNDFTVTMNKDGTFTIKAPVTVSGRYTIISKLIAANPKVVGNYEYQIVTGTPYPYTSSAYIGKESGVPITRSTVIMAGDNLYVGYIVKDRLGNEIPAAAIGTSTKFSFVLTAP